MLPRTAALLLALLAAAARAQVQRFTVVPASVNVTRGSDVTLPCSVENRPVVFLNFDVDISFSFKFIILSFWVIS